MGHERILKKNMEIVTLCEVLPGGIYSMFICVYIRLLGRTDECELIDECLY